MSPLGSFVIFPSKTPISQKLSLPFDIAIAVTNFTFLLSFDFSFNLEIRAKFLSLSVPSNHLFVLTPGKPSKASTSIPESSEITNLPSLIKFAIVSAFLLRFLQKSLYLLLHQYQFLIH